MDWSFPEARITQNVFPSIVFFVHYSMPSTVHNSFDWAGPDPLVLTNQWFLLNVSPSVWMSKHTLLSVQSLIVHFIIWFFPEDGAWQGLWYTHSMPCSLAQVSEVLETCFIAWQLFLGCHVTIWLVSKAQDSILYMVWDTGYVSSHLVLASTIASKWCLPWWVSGTVIQSICQATSYLDFSHCPPYQTAWLA